MERSDTAKAKAMEDVSVIQWSQLQFLKLPIGGELW